jgi:hypothetical protein
MKKRNLFGALMMLLITGVSLTTASYAWFSINNQVQLAGLDINVEVAEGIQVSTDAATWKAAVDLTDITTGYSGHTNQIPTTLIPVSTIGSQSTGNFEMYGGALNVAGTTTLTTSGPLVESAGNGTARYIAFDLFIQAATVTPVYLAPLSTITYDSPGAATTSGLEYSARVAFFNQGTDATSTPATARALAAGTSSSQVIWEPFALSHTTAALGLGASTTVKTAYYGVKDVGTDLAIDDFSTQTDHFELVSTITPDTDAVPFADDATSLIFTAGAGITKVRIYIWIEGQDIDNENGASLGLANDPLSTYIVTLQFRKAV